jgi:hypothetical protein
MNDEQLTEEEKEQREQWERGKNALHSIMQHIEVSKIERLADKVNDPEFRSSMYFKMFIQTL